MLKYFTMGTAYGNTISLKTKKWTTIQVTSMLLKIANGIIQTKYYLHCQIAMNSMMQNIAKKIKIVILHCIHCCITYCTFNFKWRSS